MLAPGFTSSAAGVKWLGIFLIPHPACLAGTSQSGKHFSLLPVQHCNVSNHKGGLVRNGKLLKRRNHLLKRTGRERIASVGLLMNGIPSRMGLVDEKHP